MQKISKALAWTTLALAAQASADTVLGVYAGAGYWDVDYSGDIGKSNARLNPLDIKDDNHNFYYIALEHPVPLLPNIQLQHNDISTQGTSVLAANQVVLGGNYGAGSTLRTELDLTHTDALFYYELLDNWVNLDLGAGVRKFDGFAKTTDGTSTSRRDLDGYLPMAYLKAQGDLPLTGFSVAADLRILRGLDDEVTDYSVKLAYTTDLIPLFDLGIELGYRSMELKLEDLDQLETDLKLDGPYAGVNFHF
ncbi:TIGR04219 family outer membrane beta-barrel protein [Aestuariirhabdus litorea]|uniref:TIGR04219 family outer membrane beta-barrel protein n=1 Tax=Aestuariirhabdus litorea TaxID=2528527 RepID=A0A3P3VNA5_9GAMM|nr:TIGR04219 family outer membrane beta-barrel protein [Aestuariirhabdus litorea]RRJ83827.1 TIGR04219 family outer membrane beta-barrel protein [Aestuariirhabdus litorea]RWW97050.1 TIGR04219 family outer membrane beta-barrel protein [Endozoicomonadaceae bacterium GTF-13]